MERTLLKPVVFLKAVPGTVIGFFTFRSKKASREFAAVPVVIQAGLAVTMP
jgi:hypothetical protein